METILNTSFDWNGIREAFILATENDSLNGVAMSSKEGFFKIIDKSYRLSI
jgi:hypothetical protein